NLREHFHAGAEIVQTHMVTHHRGNHLQTGDDTVTRSGFVEQDHVTGVFSPNAPAFFLQFFQHIAVAHFSTRKWNTQLLQRQLKTHVAHQRTYRATAKLALTQSFTGDDIEDLIAIDLITFVIHHDDAVAITVERNPQVGFFSQNAV